MSNNICLEVIIYVLNKIGPGYMESPQDVSLGRSLEKTGRASYGEKCGMDSGTQGGETLSVGEKPILDQCGRYMVTMGGAARDASSEVRRACWMLLAG